MNQQFIMPRNISAAIFCASFSLTSYHCMAGESQRFRLCPVFCFCFHSQIRLVFRSCLSGLFKGQQDFLADAVHFPQYSGNLCPERMRPEFLHRRKKTALQTPNILPVLLHPFIKRQQFFCHYQIGKLFGRAFQKVIR